MRISCSWRLTCASNVAVNPAKQAVTDDHPGPRSACARIGWDRSAGTCRPVAAGLDRYGNKHYPGGDNRGAAMIDSYSFGHITVDGRSYTSDLIIYPERVDSSWWRKEGHKLQLQDLQDVLEYRPEVLLVGQGNPGRMKVPDELVRELEQRGIRVWFGPTEEAVQRYNKLGTSKRVVAALHLTC